MTPAIEHCPCVLVCQHRACRKQGAALVLQSLQSLHLPGWNIQASSCLGQCGNGPMVRVLPENIWYWRVRPEAAIAIAQQHLIGGQPVQTMFYPFVPV